MALVPRTIFHLDLDAFYVAVERLLDPTLVGKPVIVSGGTARSVVAAASYEARRFGVRSAMPYSRAKRLCPQAVVLPGNFREYGKASRAFFKILQEYAPSIEPMSMDEAYLDYTGSERLFGPPLTAASAIQARVRQELGLDVSVGIAATKSGAKIASDLAKPAGLLFILPGHEAAFLAPLPIGRLLGVGPKSEARLRGLGIRTIGDMARLPQETAQKMFGEGSLGLYAAARGQDDSAVQPREQAKSISHEETFALDQANPEMLRAALHRLVCEVGYRLRRAGQRARTACVKVRYADFSLHTCSLTLPEPTDIDRTLFSAACKLLARILERRVSIRLIGFAAHNLGDQEGQMNFLDLPGKQKLDRLHVAADRIRTRYGYTTVGWASLIKPEAE